MNKGLQAGLIALTLALYATNWLHAQSTWTGASGGTWGTAGNWSPATVPNAVDAVVNINTALSVDVQNTGSGGTFPYTFGTLSIPSGAVVMGDPNNSGEQLKAQVSTGVPTFAISSGATLWFYFILNGTQGFNKTGAGELTFRYNYETQPYTGSIIISGGDICLTQDSNLGNTSNGITFSNNARLYLNPYTPTAISLASSRTLTLACSAANLDVATGNTFTIPGVIGESSAGQGLQKNGSGPLVLSGTNTYTGATKISGGTLSVGATNNLGAPA
ncbi:MAG: autotransporter-associated beta strand repeat-containing protein, partial [Verrucomicrobiota bacterium]